MGLPRSLCTVPSLAGYSVLCVAVTCPRAVVPPEGSGKAPCIVAQVEKYIPDLNTLGSIYQIYSSCPRFL